MNSSMAIPARLARGRKTIKRGPGKRIVEGQSFRLADEVRYIQRRAANQDGRVVTLGRLILFSTKTGDAWLLDPADRLAARLARNGESEPIHIEERSEEHTSELQSQFHLVCRLLLEKKKKKKQRQPRPQQTQQQ